MENTGRILRGITPGALRILYGAKDDDASDSELKYVSRVDRAHLVMLIEQGIIDKERACKLFEVIRELDESDFAPLLGRTAPRGIYLLYEDYLIEQLGAETGGVLHTGRSRNDLNATVLRLRLRKPYLYLLREGLRLQAVLIRRARRHAAVIMPAYTHHQAAVPVTYGHYLAGVACALGRDLKGVQATLADLQRSPLGAGAVGGTSLPINPARTASLLGFDGPAPNSIDAVASRDFVLHLLASASILGVTLSRLATDLLLWTTSEFGFLSLPDELVGSSSMMPQKRNPFLLENVQGLSASALGAFVNSATAMHSKPFTNSIAVGTEGVSPVWQAIRNVKNACTLARLVVAGAAPQPEAMLRRAAEGYTSATEFANQLVVHAGMPFRRAHHIVGAIIRTAIESGAAPLQDAVDEWRKQENPNVQLNNLDPTSVAHSSDYGGGPGPSSLASCIHELHEEWSLNMLRLRQQSERWKTSEATLNETVRRLCH